MRRVASLLIACGVVVTIGLSALAAPPLPAVAQSISIIEYFFNPDTRSIAQSDQIVWTNNGQFKHTTTSDTGLWDSGDLTAGMTFSVTFTQTGTFAFHCSIHPFMTGTIHVVAPPTPTLTATRTRTPTATRTATLPPPP